MSNRLPYQIKLFKNGEVVETTTLKLKTRVLRFVQGKKSTEWDLGYVRLTYNAKQGYYNHAEFSSIDQLKALIDEFSDIYLVKQFSA